MPEVSKNVEFFNYHVMRPPHQGAFINLSGVWKSMSDLKLNEMAMVWALDPFFSENTAGPSPALSQEIRHKLDTYGYTIINNCPYRERRFFEEDAQRNKALRMKLENADSASSVIADATSEDAAILERIVYEGEHPSAERYIHFSALEAQIENHKFDLRGIMKSLGHIVSFENEGGCGEVSLIKPSQDIVSNERSFKTSGEFELHTDLSYQESPPDYMGLLVGQSDLQRVAQMQFSHIDNALMELSSQTIRELQKPQFHFKLPERGQNENPSEDGECFVTGSVLMRCGRGFFGWGGLDNHVRFRRDTVMGITKAANGALDELSKAFFDAAVGYFPQPGTVVIVDNRKVVHGRTPFVATYDKDDRYLLRVYANEESPTQSL